MSICVAGASGGWPHPPLLVSGCPSEGVSPSVWGLGGVTLWLLLLGPVRGSERASLAFGLTVASSAPRRRPGSRWEGGSGGRAP